MKAATAPVDTMFVRAILAAAPTYGWELEGASNGYRNAIGTKSAEVAIAYTQQGEGEGSITLRDVVSGLNQRAHLFVSWQGIVVGEDVGEDVLYDWNSALDKLVWGVRSTFRD
jgi:hypothetical protein